MVQFRDIQLKRQARESRKQNKLSFKRAVLVDEFGNQTSTAPLDDVWAASSERRVWYMHEGAVQPAQILCRKVSDPYVGLGVIIGYADGSNQLEVLTDDFFLTGTGDPTGWASTAPRDFEPGGLKQMWVYTKVITPLATYPGSGISVNVVSGDYPYLGTRKTYAGSVNFALTSNPNPGEHYLAGLYLDAANTLQVVYGASVVVATTPPEPSWPAGAFRLSAVRINDTQTTIDFADDVFDRRMAWSDEISSSAGWPFANVLSVSTTDPDADYTTVTAAIAAASAGDGILLDIESSAETITVNKAIYLIGLARGGTVFTNSITITAAATLINIKVTHTAAAARGFIGNQAGVAVLYNCEAVTSGSATSRAIEQTNSGSTQVYGGYYEASGAGTSFEVFVSAGSVILYNQPVLFTGAISGTAAGQYTTSGGDLLFASGTGMSAGCWLYDANGTRDFYRGATLGAALVAAAAVAGAGDIIHLFPGTYTLTSQLAYGAAFTIEGEGPETIINCATNSISLLLLNSAGAALRNLAITHSGAGILNSGVYITANATVENVTVTLSGAATANYPILQQGGTATLTNVTATATAATTNHAYRNDTGDATVTFNGGRLSGTQQDIYGERAGSSLYLNNTVLVNRLADWDGTVDGSIDPRLVAYTQEIYQGITIGLSDFVATINGAPAGTSVVYNAPSSGDEATIVPSVTTHLAKMVLHNTTRGDSALISNVNTGTNTITLTANAPAGWANTDTITIRSQTNTSTISAGVYFVDFQIVSEVDPLTAGLELEMTFGDSGGAGQNIRLHPYQASSVALRRGFTTQSTQNANGYRPIPIISRTFCAAWTSSGATTVSTVLLRALKELVYGL